MYAMLGKINEYWMSIPIPDAIRALITLLVFRNVLFALKRLIFGASGTNTDSKHVDKGFVIDCLSLEHLEDELQKAKRKKKAVCVDYGAKWCPPCQRVKPIFAKMSREFAKECVFLAVDVDKARDASSAAKIQCMPTFQFYEKTGEKLDDEVRGMDVSKLKKIVTNALGCAATADFEEDIIGVPYIREGMHEDQKKKM